MILISSRNDLQFLFPMSVGSVSDYLNVVVETEMTGSWTLAKESIYFCFAFPLLLGLNFLEHLPRPVNLSVPFSQMVSSNISFQPLSILRLLIYLFSFSSSQFPLSEKQHYQTHLSAVPSHRFLFSQFLSVFLFLALPVALHICFLHQSTFSSYFQFKGRV